MTFYSVSHYESGEPECFSLKSFSETKADPLPNIQIVNFKEIESFKREVLNRNFQFQKGEQL